MMKFKEVKELSAQELDKRIKESRKEIFEMNIKNKMGQLANPVQIRFARRQLAQYLTAQGAQELKQVK